MRARTVGVLALVLVAAGACSGSPGSAANGKICSPFPVQPPASTDPAAVTAATAGGDAVALDDCLHRWGYRLARSPDTAEVVGKAVAAACSPVLSRWNQTSVTAQPAATPESDQAVSLVTGKLNNTPTDRYEMAEAKALFYVVQARAGNCAAP